MDSCGCTMFGQDACGEFGPCPAERCSVEEEATVPGPELSPSASPSSSERGRDHGTQQWRDLYDRDAEREEYRHDEDG